MNDMNREEAKKLLPIMQAYAEGKTIQVKLKTDGKALTVNRVDVTNPDWDTTRCYRIKPEPTYRPFKNTDECWEEMQKHQPFGWLMHNGYRHQITSMTANFGVFCDNGCDNLTLTGYLNDGWTFADGTPFGMKEDGTKTE